MVEDDHKPYGMVSYAALTDMMSYIKILPTVATVTMNLPAVGTTGGIILAWRSRIGVVLSSRLDSFSSSVQFSSPGEPWWLTCVYGPQGNDAKIAFLQEIRNI
jgi:hypothetical protein